MRCYSFAIYFSEELGPLFLPNPTTAKQERKKKDTAECQNKTERREKSPKLNAEP
jgi:hypothetical protein